MSMECQTRSVVRSMFYHLRRIGKIRNHLDDDTAARTINALITSRLDNNNSLLAGTSHANIHRLQLAQNASARVLTRSRKYDSIGPILKQLHWLPVERRITFKILTQVYKALNDSLYPLYLRQLFVEYSPRRSLRSSDAYRIVCVPRSHNAYGDRQFSKYAAIAWNSLPDTVRACTNLGSFKRAIKTHLFS